MGKWKVAGQGDWGMVVGEGHRQNLVQNVRDLLSKFLQKMESVGSV